MSETAARKHRGILVFPDGRSRWSRQVSVDEHVWVVVWGAEDRFKEASKSK
jgi:hypothetical protein